MSRIAYLRNISLGEFTFDRLREAFLRRFKDIPHYHAWHNNDKEAQLNKEKLQRYHNIHRGKRCFIVANGPSLKVTDLSLLKDEITIGMNRIYLTAKETGFDPTYIVVQDISIQLMQFQEDFDRLEKAKFFNWNARKYFKSADNLNFIRSDFSPHFSTDLTKSSWGGHSVTYICIQLAFYMGFDEVYLVGKDHNYEQKGVPGKLVKATGDEKNHFASGYYKKGMSWRIPDYKGEELGYQMAKDAFEKHGRKIYDATVNGQLQVFNKVDYYSLFRKKSNEVTD